MNKIILEDFENLCFDPTHLNYFKDKKILVTGGTGFLAGYLVKYLIYLKKYKKLNLEIYCTYRSLKRVKKKFNTNELQYINLIESGLNCSFKKDFFHYVFHAASIASPKYFRDFPIQVIEPNIFGLFNLINSIDINYLKNFVLFSTTGVTGFVDNAFRPNAENIYGPLDCADISNCYLESKRMAEMICMAWFHQKSMPICIIRPSITYGPGIELDDGRSYADFIKNISEGKNIEIKSDGSALRNFLYVADFLRGIFIAMFEGKVGDVFNIASSKEISILDLCNFLVNEVFPDKKLNVVLHNEHLNNYLRINFQRTSADVSKISQLGWKENVSIQDGFRRTVSYYESL